jgi:proteic killer suppression protein
MPYTSFRYTVRAVAIRSFASEALKIFFEEGRTSARLGWSNVARVVARKLDMLHYANDLRDLASPPGNRLEALKGSLAGLHSIRVNDQWRVVFRWSEFGPEDVDVVDYH